MKKIIIAFLLCLFSIAAYSGAPTCRVYGTNTIATISQFYQEYKEKPNSPTIFRVAISLTDKTQSRVTVVVELYQDGNFVGSKTITVSSGFESSNVEQIFVNNNYNPNGGQVTAEIATASCQ